MSRLALIFTAPALTLASCAAVPADNARAQPCPISGSSDWTAWVNAMPGPGASPKLIVAGKVTVPTGGYAFAWRDLRMMESSPGQVGAELEAIPPDSSATQAPETHDVRGEWPIGPPVGSVTVRCDDRVLAQISPVETAQ